MKKKIILSIGILFCLCTYAQSWTKISSNFDSLWTTSVKYYNHGDVIIYYGGIDGPGAFSPQRYFVSTDGGYTFLQDTAPLSRIGVNFNSLPINDLFIGYKNVPNSGSLKFNGNNDWSYIYPDVSMWGDINSGKVFCGQYVYTVGNYAAPIGTITNIPNNMRCSIVSGNRVLLGGDQVSYFDNNNYTSINNSTFTPQLAAGGIIRFFKSNNLLFAVAGSPQQLYKSTDNGTTFSLVNTTLNGGNFTAAFIIGTPNGNIFFLETSSGTSDNVFLSKDDGQTVQKIAAGLPINGERITPNVGKILTNGNKVWYQVCKANSTDFIRTDTAIAGLYLFSEGSTGINDYNSTNYAVTLFPNPVKNQLSIICDNDANTKNTVTISSVLGQKIIDTDFNENIINIDTSPFQPGVYFVTISTLHKSTTKKIIIE